LVIALHPASSRAAYRTCGFASFNQSARSDAASAPRVLAKQFFRDLSHTLRLESEFPSQFRITEKSAIPRPVEKVGRPATRFTRRIRFIIILLNGEVQRRPYGRRKEMEAKAMIEGLSFSILVPAALGLFASFVWVAMLFMFKAKAKIEYREGMITVIVKNARITRIERNQDRVVVHLDREVEQQTTRLAA
jgi:hypothetical protein